MKVSSNLFPKDTNRRSSFLNRATVDTIGLTMASPVSSRCKAALAFGDGRLWRFPLIYLPKTIFSNFSAADKNLFLSACIPQGISPSKPQ